MDAAKTMVDLLIKSQLARGKTREEAYKFALDHCEAILSRMVQTEKTVRLQIERRVENIKKFMP